jgi:vacuolar protein sorting-associated protein 13A/C
MLEGLVSSLLNRFLGMYIRNFDPGQLKVGIWSGDVKLRDLELRREALDQLKLPINVVEGHLGQLTLKIPWSNLRGQPVQIEIEDVFLLAAPKEDAEYDEEEEERRRQAVKIEKLDSAEMLKDRNQEGMSQEEQQKNQSFTESLVTKIVDNLQIRVKNIHVRYEDSISTPGHPFALGITLEEFSAISTDGEWKPTYIQDSAGPTHKLATLGALAVYWNTDTSLLGSGREAEVPGLEVSSHSEMLAKFKEMIVKGEDPAVANHQFILKPVSGKAKIAIDKSGKADRPHIKSGLIFDEIGLVLDDDQYRDALMMVDLFHYFIRHQEYKKLQPKGVSPKEDPKAWLQFAGNAILSKIHERNRRWSWSYFKERRDDRTRYIELFKKKKKQPEALTPDETKEIEKLEWKLNYEDMRFWRSLARNQLKKENVGVQKASTAKAKQGWVAWAWGSKPAEEQEEDAATTMSDEQRKELYNAIEWDEKTALAESVDLPKETIKMQINASLNTGSFTLKKNPHQDTTEVLSLFFDGFQAKFLQRPESLFADVSLDGLRVNDGTTPNSLFKQIVRVKDAPDAPKKLQIKDTEEEETESNSKVERDPFFNFQFEQNPLDGASDLAITGKLKPLEIIWNPLFLVGIMNFFKPPERHMESIGALMESAGATVEGFRQQTRAGLEFALEEHKTVNAKLDLQAPLIIVPENITSEKTACLILDAGHISVNSQLVDKHTLKNIQAKQKQAYTDDDYKRLESLMYDKFLVKLSSTQLLIGPSIGDTKLQLDQRDDAQAMHIVEKINVDFIVQLSIIPKAPNLTKVRVSGNLPVLHVSVSDKKYKSLMKIIDVAIPKLDDDEAITEAPAAKNQSRLRASSTGSTLTKSKSHERSQSASFNFATQEAVILEDDSSEDDDAEFEDASNETDNEKFKVQQKNFELKFEVDRLQGSLFRSDPEGRKQDQLLAELVAEDFALELVVRPFDLIINTSLGSLVLDDYIDNPPAEFKSILSSGDADSESEKDLVSVKIVKVNRDSPEFMPKYEGIEINIDVAISTINLVVTRKTLLTLLDFVLVTFTNSESAVGTTPSSKEVEDSPDSENGATAAVSLSEGDTGSIRIKVDLKSIRLILNNDGIRLATLSLNEADVGIFVMGKTLRVAAKLGDLSLLDDINQGASSDSNLRKLITIQGDDLADFRYETFDPDGGNAYPGYDSSIYLRAGSIKLNFLEEPFRKIIDFLVKFGQMQAIFNAARQAAADQASQIQQNANRMKFDIIVKTPIVVFPRTMVAGRPKRDLITAYLGEIYAENKFLPLDDSKDAAIAMNLTAGVRNIRLTSDFYFENDKSEELELIDKVDLGFTMTYAEHSSGSKRPDMEIDGSMTDFTLRVTQLQLKFLLELSRSVPAAFAADPDGSQKDATEDVPQSTLKKAKTITNKNSDSSSEALVDLGPELGVNSKGWTKLDLAFQLRKIGLELILAKEDEPTGDLDASSLAKFSLDDTKVKLRMMTDGSLESELLIQSFTIQDSRTKETNKFRKIMTSLNKDVQQFMASVTISGGKERNLIAMVAIDSPRIIFALDYLFALQSWISFGLMVDEPVISEHDESLFGSPDESESDSLMAINDEPSRVGVSRTATLDRASTHQSEPSSDSNMSVAFRLNVVNAQIILIANPLSSSSEAIVLGTKQILVAQQHALTVQVMKMGMFLCRMDKFEDSRLRVLDDFSLQMSLDSSQTDLTSFHIDIEPLVLRLSLRDILLAIQIVSKASELSGDDDNGKKKALASDQKAKQLKTGTPGLKQRTASGKGLSTVGRRTKAPTVAPNRAQDKAPEKVVRKHEELTATLDGMRLILIGDLHELPILDLSVKSFTTTANDWSSSLRAGTNIDLFVNIYNFSKSAWEPLIEPWQLGFEVAKDAHPDALSVNFVSDKTLELTVTSATIALASKSADFLTQSDDVLSKPRGTEAPYRMRNYTGFDINVWADVSDEDNQMAAKLADGEEGPWRFEDWEKMRENLSPEDSNGIVGIRLEGSGFDSINKIPVTREGETIYNLRPRKNQIMHRLLVEVSLGDDNVKCITFRSPLLVENKTQIPVELGVFDAQEGHLLKIEKIAPGESRPAPVGAAYLKSLLVRPDQGFGYTWSTESLYWKDLMKRPTRTMICKGENDKQTPPFYFQMHASYDKTNPLPRYVLSRLHQADVFIG